MHNTVSLLPIACALVLGIMVLAANSTSPAAKTPAPIGTFALADLPNAQFEQGAWSGPAPGFGRDAESLWFSGHRAAPPGAIHFAVAP